MYENEIQPFLEKFYISLGNSKLKHIIKYSLDGGKYIRGFIVKHVIETLTSNNSSVEIPWEPIVSVELIQSASLIIDDLPCMDNDLFRRGKKSTFHNFGEREAILSALYIISQSIKISVSALDDIQEQVMPYIEERIKRDSASESSSPLSKQGFEYYRLFKDQKNMLVKLTNEWSDLLGENLIVGQLLDLKEDVEKLFNLKMPDNNPKTIIIYKTCSLFMFSFLQGAFFAKTLNITTNIKQTMQNDNSTISIDISDNDFNDFKNMGLHFGMMFQLMDDYNDIEQDKLSKSYNFINYYGLTKAIDLFTLSKQSLITLMIKCNIYTQQMKDLIHIISLKFNKGK
jgi:geranylgeranyl pyrophosphate synthase|uniref:Uncharacterized protein n=1 Tax=viral metagenome TaxID=1070528 RepID=A0A6C0JDB5_9ZZZZ